MTKILIFILVIILIILIIVGLLIKSFRNYLNNIIRNIESKTNASSEEDNKKIIYEKDGIVVMKGKTDKKTEK